MLDTTDDAASLPAVQTATPLVPSTTVKLERITSKVRTAIDAMVWEGLPRGEAATKAGISEHGLYKALLKPPVKAYYLNQCEVLRTSGRARRIHRLEAMLEQDANKAAVINAALALESIGNDQASVNAQQTHSPGVVIQIINSGPADARLTQTVIEQPKLIDISDG